MTWGDGWLLVGLLVATLELVAMLRAQSGDTLSEQIWAVLKVRWFRPLAWAAWALLTIHFFFHW